MKFIQVFLSFLKSVLEASRKPSIMWFAKVMLLASLGELGAQTFSAQIPIQAWGVTVTIGGNDSGFFVLLFVVSLVLLLYGEYREKKEADDSLLIAVRHMGLVDHGIDDIQNYLPKTLKRIRSQAFSILHVNSHQTNDMGELEAQLQNIHRLPQYIQDSGNTLNNAKKHILYGGVAPVPMVAAAGHIISNMQNVYVGDWDREKKKWHFNNEFDDGELLKFEEVDSKGYEATALTIAISLSIPIRKNVIQDEFSENALIEVTYALGNYKYDNASSSEKQERLAKSILEFINSNIIPNYPNLEKLDILITAQASLVFRIGSVLNQGHLPKIVFHHFNPKSENKKHPWGVVLNDGKNGYKVVA